MEKAPAPPETRRVRTADGRWLVFDRYGDPGGRPLLYCHGWPGSRREAVLAAPAAARLGACLVAVDRPGMGGSTFQRRRRFADWPRDAARVMDALGHRRFGVIGVSGGGPYALATAALLPGRVRAVAVACGMGPADDPRALAAMLWTGRALIAAQRAAPGAARTLFRAIRAWGGGLGDDLIHLLEPSMPPADRRVWADRELLRTLAAAVREAFRQGPRGELWDGALYTLPWGLPLGRIRAPVRLLHGERDTVVPIALGEIVARRVPGARLARYADEGHWSLAIRHAEEVVAAASGRPAE